MNAKSQHKAAVPTTQVNSTGNQLVNFLALKQHLY